MQRAEEKLSAGPTHFSAVFTLASSMAAVGLLLVAVPYFVSSLSIDSGMRLLTQVGTVLLTSGLLGVLYQYTIRRSFVTEVENRLRQIINERFESLEDQRTAGVERIYEGLPIDAMKKGFEDAEREVRILQTWTGNIDTIRESLCVAAAKENCKVRVLLLHPDSEHVDYRNKDIGNVGAEHAKGRILAELDTLSALQARPEVDGRLEVKLYRVTPVMSIHGYDDTNIVGLYWRGVSSAAGPQFETASRPGQESFFANRVKEHFEKVWKHDETTDASDYQEQQ